MKELDRQENILNFIKKYIKTNKYSPTIREICEGIGVKSTSQVHRYLIKLKANKKIDFITSKPRTITIGKGV